MKYLVPILFLFISTYSNAQNDAMDFWVGNWELSWKDAEGQTIYGSNNIDKVLSNKVIQENFTTLETDESQRFIGKSWSVWSPQTQSWSQTWVDNSGAYLDFKGEMSDETRIFKREFKKKDGSTIQQRMVFFNIENNQFDWRWESSGDGTNWQILWQIHYKRK